MKITHLAAAVAMIAVCGLAHADEGPPPPPPQAYGQPGYGPQGPGPYAPVEEDGYSQEIVRRRTVIVPGVPVGPPAIAGLAQIIPTAIPFPPRVSGGCGVLQNRNDPHLFRVLILWRNDAPPFDTGVVESRFVEPRMQQLRDLGFCRGGPGGPTPTMRLN